MSYTPSATRRDNQQGRVMWLSLVTALCLTTAGFAFIIPPLPSLFRFLPPHQHTESTFVYSDTAAIAGNFNLLPGRTFNAYRACSRNDFRLHADTRGSVIPSDNSTHGRIEATALAETIPVDASAPVGDYQITRPRWYNKAEAAVIVLLVQRLRLLDVRGVEHMLEATDAFRNVNPDDILERALCLMRIAPGANFRTVIARHPRTLLASSWQMTEVCDIISEAFPDANMARVVERIPSIFSRNASRLKRNIDGLKEHVPEVDSAIFQAAPSMIFIPPKTIQRKVEMLRRHLIGVNLHTVLKGMPTVLARSEDTVPRGLNALRKRFPGASDRDLARLVEAAPGLVRMSGLNGTLDVKVDALADLLPGVNVTGVFANAPGVLIRSVNSLPKKVNKLEVLFPSANVTKMVSRTPGILYLDVDRTIKPKALWIKDIVGLDQDGLDALVETGPWLLKAGWGPLSRLEFAVDAGVASAGGSKPLASALVGLVRHSRAAFAAAHYPAYGNFLRRRLQEEQREGEVGLEEDNFESDPRESRKKADAGKKTDAKSKKRNSGKTDEGVVVEVAGDGVVGDGGKQREIMEDTFKEVGLLEDRLGRARKARLGGVRDWAPTLGRSRRTTPVESIDVEHMAKEAELQSD